MYSNYLSIKDYRIHMKFERNNRSVLHYVLKRLEMALGLGLILLVAINEDILSSMTALTIFVIALLVSLPKLIAGTRALKSTHLELVNDCLYIKSASKEQAYNLRDFKILLYKKGPKGITAFVLMSETQGVKLEYYSDMSKLFLELSQYVKMKKKVPWWQRL